MRSYWPLILSLAAMWGASYLFIKVAVEDIPPAAMTELRVLLAGVLLFGYLAWRMGASRAVAELRAAWVPCAVLGVINAALPMGLVAWGETHIDSSVAGIAQSTVPLFTFLLAAKFLPHEHVGMVRIVGVGLGFLGVALLAGFRRRGGWWASPGRSPSSSRRSRTRAAASTGSCRFTTSRDPSSRRATCSPRPSCSCRWRSPTRRPKCRGRRRSPVSPGSILIPTFAGQLLLFRVLRLHGSRKLSIVTYLMPAFAVAYGALLLDEPSRPRCSPGSR